VNYYERHIGDYLKDTAHLSLLEHGIYSRLLDIYYSRDGAVPADQVMRLVGARTDEERSAVRDVLNEFFDIDGDVLRHSRCDREIAKYQDKQRKASASANARWSNTTAKSECSADAVRTHSEGNAPNPNPNPNKEKTARKRAAPVGASCPDSVSEDVWRDWTALRKAKRAPVSPTVLAEAEREAGKAGMTLDAFLRVWCARGSQGLQADWLKPHEVGSTPISANSRALRRETEEFKAQQNEHARKLADPAEQARILAIRERARGAMKVV
jgi:uncharacterized protein YdaU (DUF1376 family)